MTAVIQLSALPLVHALGWSLLHFLWQGAIVAITLACALALLPSRASRLRYAAACAAMALLVLLPGITFCMLATSTQPDAAAASAEPLGQALNSNFELPAELWTARCERIIDQSLPAVIGFWFLGVLVLLCRLNVGLLAARKLKSFAVEPASEETQHIFRALCARLSIQRPVKLLDSALVQAPSVIGWLRPAILLPLGCVTGMSSLQLEAILAHELAHIRRHDYLVSLLQSVVETLLFYHPAVWWVSKQIRQEREHCCDDLAVAICGDRLAYAKALSFLEEHRSPMPAGVFGLTGGALKMRIARLLGLKPAPVFPRTPAAILLVLAAAAIGMAVWGTARAQSAAQQQDTASHQRVSGKAVNHSQNAASAASNPVHLRSLTIDSNDLPESDRLEIVQAFQGSTYPLTELLLRVRQNLRNRGYILATVTLLHPLAAPAGKPPQPVNASLRISAGAKYTLNRIEVQGNQAFPLEQIIQQFPLHSGDMFNATAIGKGLDNLKKLYASKGYVHFGAMVRPQFDNVRHTVTLILDLKEGHATGS